METENNRCADLNQEHVFFWDSGKWKCRSTGCDEAILEAQMNSILERDVATDTGHVMWIWPAMVEQERKRGL
jgi:hypothetical protein